MSYRGEVLADSPLAYWRLGDSGSTAADETGNGHTGTLVGGVTTGIAGAIIGDSDKAMSFDGVVGTVINASALGALSAWTLECWAKPNGAQWANSALMSDVYSSTVEYALTLHGTGLGNSDSDFMVRAGVYDTAWHTSAPVTMTDGVWQHVVATWDGALILIYLNAAPAGSVAYSHGPFSNNLGFHIGSTWDNSQLNSFKGSLDEVAVYGAGLSQARISTHYTVGTTDPNPTGTPVKGPTGASAGSGRSGASIIGPNSTGGIIGPNRVGGV